jgi:hypothetical protein
MNYPIQYKNIPSNVDFYSELTAQYNEAESYLNSFSWCRKINECSLYSNLGKVFCIFLFEIENLASKEIEDGFLWVIVGDIPPMYLDTFSQKTTKKVIETYIRLAENWINGIKSGTGVNDCYPFSANPTLELAELLEKKIIFMKNTLLNNIEDIPLSE